MRPTVFSRQKKAVFDAGRQVEVQLRSAEGTKTVKVRFPTDEEWTERQRRRKIVIKQLGRGISETLAQRRQVRQENILCVLCVFA